MYVFGSSKINNIMICSWLLYFDELVLFDDILVVNNIMVFNFVWVFVLLVFKVLVRCIWFLLLLVVSCMGLFVC